MSSKPVLPGATLGILGSGQLGRMFAIAAKRLGYNVHVFSPDQNSPAGQVSDHETTADYLDQEQVVAFAKKVDVVSYEFENIPTDTVQWIAEHTPVRPGVKALETAQHRAVEKTFVQSVGVPVTPFKSMNELGDINDDDSNLFPAIMKTVRDGYDGKGQTTVETLADVESAWNRLGQKNVILEKRVEFVDEQSVIGVRGQDGSFVSYGPFLNDHENHILSTSVVGPHPPEELKSKADEIAKSIMDALDYVGVLCIEFFRTQDNQLLVNELAPRPHNSGHITIDSHVTCQFEQQVRSICGLPLGDPTCLRPAAMANLLGDLWANGEPNWANALSDGKVKLHLYGKSVAKVGRKMGHLNVLADSPEEAVQKAIGARAALRDVNQG